MSLNTGHFSTLSEVTGSVLSLPGSRNCSFPTAGTSNRLCCCVRYWNLGGRGDVADRLLTQDRLQDWETVIE